MNSSKGTNVSVSVFNVLKSAKIFAALTFYISVAHCFHLQQDAFAGSLGEAIDCTQVRVDYEDDPSLTREERLRLMDQAFFQSLSKFELCQAAARAKTKSAGSNGDGGDGAGNNGAGDGSADAVETGGITAGSSVAGSTMSGTEESQTSQKIPSAEGIESGQRASLPGSQTMHAAKSRYGKNSTPANGKLPEDIPSAKNDDALAAQIRYAAENEPDPVKSAQLWNEYRKYKGLATR